MKAGERLGKREIRAEQHHTEPPPRYTEASLVKRMEELGIGRPSTYASTLATLRDRDYVEVDKKRLRASDKGMLVTAFLESFFARYVEYGFTAGLEEDLDRVSNDEIDWKEVLRRFWADFSAQVAGATELRIAQVLDALNEILGSHIFPSRDGAADPRACPACAEGRLSLKLGKFGAFVGCSNYPECRYTRQLSGAGEAAGEEGGGPRVLGRDPESGLDVTLRDGRFGPYVQLGEGEKPKRQTLPKGVGPGAVDLAKALLLLSLPREGRAPSGIGRADPRRDRPLRSVCPTWQDLCEPRARRRRAGDRREPRDRPRRRQGGWRRARAPGWRRERAGPRRASEWRADHPSGRPLRDIRQPR